MYFGINVESYRNDYANRHMKHLPSLLKLLAVTKHKQAGRRRAGQIMNCQKPQEREKAFNLVNLLSSTGRHASQRHHNIGGIYQRADQAWLILQPLSRCSKLIYHTKYTDDFNPCFFSQTHICMHLPIKTHLNTSPSLHTHTPKSLSAPPHLPPPIRAAQH